MSKDLKGIIQPKDEDTVWRYMSFEKFANILATESLFFTRADKYDDKFEGYVPESTTLSYESSGSQIVPNFRQYIMCNCWHHGDEESMAMWDKYHLRNNGIAIKTTMGNLKNSLPDKPNVFIGKIDYIVDYNQIDMVEDVPPEIWLHYPYFYKRTPFKYEQEVRAIIDVVSCLQDDPYEFGRPLKIDVKALIGNNSEVIVSPHADKWIARTLELIVKRYRFQLSVNPSKLLDPPV